MKYTHNAHITTVEEVKEFFRHVVYELGINIHPDDDFKDYINSQSGVRYLDDVEASIYNRLMDEAFEICGDKVYDIGCIVLREQLKQ